MANLEMDLRNKLLNNKYFAEVEFVRLAQESNINYEEKISKMTDELKKIVISDKQLTEMIRFFAPPQQNQNIPSSEGTIHQGQTHGE